MRRRNFLYLATSALGYGTSQLALGQAPQKKALPSPKADIMPRLRQLADGGS